MLATCYNQNFIEDKIKCALFNFRPSWKNQNKVSSVNNRCNGQSEQQRTNESKASSERRKHKNAIKQSKESKRKRITRGSEHHNFPSYM